MPQNDPSADENPLACKPGVVNPNEARILIELRMYRALADAGVTVSPELVEASAAQLASMISGSNRQPAAERQKFAELLADTLIAGFIHGVTTDQYEVSLRFRTRATNLVQATGNVRAALAAQDPEEWTYRVAKLGIDGEIQSEWRLWSGGAEEVDGLQEAVLPPDDGEDEDPDVNWIDDLD